VEEDSYGQSKSPTLTVLPMVYCDEAKGRQKFVGGNIYDEFANRNR